MTGMVRGRRRRVRGASAALRWVAADARDVARIHGSSARPVVVVAVPTVARGVTRWRWRVERRRLLALARRGALVGVSAACLLQIGALASGRDGLGLWLLPAAIVAALSLASGLAHRTSAATAARLLDRDLELGAEVCTGLELDTSAERSAGRSGLGALALADGRDALGGTLAGARARLQPRRGEVALLGTLIAALAVLLLVPSPRSDGSSSAKPRAATSANRALRGESGPPGSAGPGATLRGFKQTPLNAPPLAAVQAGGTTRTGGAASGRGPYGGGIADDTRSGAVQAVSRTAGQTGSVKGTRADSASSSSAGAGKGSSASGSAGTAPNGSSGGAGPGGTASDKGVAPLSGGQPSSQGGSSPGGKAGKRGGNSQGGNGSSAPGTVPARTPSRSAPGGATAGATAGAKSAGHGVVPQLRGGTGLPLAPAYEAVPGSSGARGVSASPTAGGAGGAAHSRQANGGAAGSGGGAGVAYVPPGGATVASIDRGVVLGYFGSFARVNASGW
jgi:hypothetical protein